MQKKVTHHHTIVSDPTIKNLLGQTSADEDVWHEVRLRDRRRPRHWAKKNTFLVTKQARPSAYPTVIPIEILREFLPIKVRLCDRIRPCSWAKKTPFLSPNRPANCFSNCNSDRNTSRLLAQFYKNSAAICPINIYLTYDWSAVSRASRVTLNCVKNLHMVLP